MAKILSVTTVGGRYLIYLNDIPTSSGGTTAPEGSQAFVAVGGVGSLWLKQGSGDSDWVQLSSGGGSSSYIPSNPSDWGDVVPSTSPSALDQLASDDSFKSITLADNVLIPTTFLSYPKTSKARFIFFLMERGTSSDLVYQQLLTDGLTIVGGVNKNSIGSTGIVLSKIISGSNVELQYTSTSTGVAPTLKYKWLAKL